MADTTKTMTKRDAEQTSRMSYNDVDASFGVSGFLTAKVGRRIDIEIIDEVEVYTYSESGQTLFELTLTYTDSSRETLESAERTA